MRRLLENLWQRTDCGLAPTTIIGILLLAIIYPLMRWAPAVLFVENGWAENLQLIILAIATGIALSAKYEKKMFVLVAFAVLFLMVREINGGRAFFCKLYLAPNEVCRWSSMKYGWVSSWVRWGLGIGVLLLALYGKLWRPLGKYVAKAPVFVWDMLLFVLALIGAQAAETSMIDNEIMEESAETVMYVMLAGLIWRYSRVKVK